MCFAIVAGILAAVGLTAPGPARAIGLNPLSVIKGAVEAAVEDRSAIDIAKGAAIKAKITANVIDKMGTDVVSINADVYEQDVMLTGTVKTTAQKVEAGRYGEAGVPDS